MRTDPSSDGVPSECVERTWPAEEQEPAASSAQRPIGEARSFELSPDFQLPPRQRQCIGWWAKGKSASEIAIIIGISPRTVEEHLWRLCKTFGVTRRRDVVRILIEAGRSDLIF